MPNMYVLPNPLAIQEPKYKVVYQDFMEIDAMVSICHRRAAVSVAAAAYILYREEAATTVCRIYTVRAPHSLVRSSLSNHEV